MGPAWADKVGSDSAVDAHNLVECSNNGLCNYHSGQCQCFEGFTGDACQRSTCTWPQDCVQILLFGSHYLARCLWISGMCPSSCSGFGYCKSIKDISLAYGSGVVAAAGYTNWDSSVLYGCVCDAGRVEADCSACTQSHHSFKMLCCLLFLRWLVNLQWCALAVTTLLPPVRRIAPSCLICTLVALERWLETSS